MQRGQPTAGGYVGQPVHQAFDRAEPAGRLPAGDPAVSGVGRPLSIVQQSTVAHGRRGQRLARRGLHRKAREPDDGADAGAGGRRRSRGRGSCGWCHRASAAIHTLNATSTAIGTSLPRVDVGSTVGCRTSGSCRPRQLLRHHGSRVPAPSVDVVRERPATPAAVLMSRSLVETVASPPREAIYKADAVASDVCAPHFVSMMTF